MKHVAVAVLVVMASSICLNLAAEEVSFPLDERELPVRGFADSYFPGECGYHLAEDYDVEPGTAVKAASSGTVVYSGNLRGLGHALILEHHLDGWGIVTTNYYHMSKLGSGGIPWAVGDQIDRGEVVGYVSGEQEDYGPIPHLHFGVRRGAFRPGIDERTRKWFYPGYTVLRNEDDIKLCDLDQESDMQNPLHLEIVSEWISPSDFFEEISEPEPFRNGGFEDGVDGQDGWKIHADAWIGTNLSNSRTGAGYAAVGVARNGSPKSGARGYFEQEFTIPGNATYAVLTFFVDIDTKETTTEAKDRLTVSILDGSGVLTRRVLLNASNANAGQIDGYTRMLYDLRDFIGDTIRLRFEGNSSPDEETTTFRIDDVVLRTDS